MSTAAVALLLIAAEIWGRTEGFSDEAMDCCFSVSGTKVPTRIAAAYFVQIKNNGCPIAATVFITKKGRKICSPPVEDKAFSWVAKLIAQLKKQEEMSLLQTNSRKHK